jgi:hypothetical protein
MFPRTREEETGKEEDEAARRALASLTRPMFPRSKVGTGKRWAESKQSETGVDFKKISSNRGEIFGKERDWEKSRV